MHAQAPHILEWVSEHSAQVVGPDAATELIAVLDQLPWPGVSLDKSAIAGVILTDNDLDDPGVLTRVRATRLGRHTHAYVMYAPGEPGLIAPVSAVIADLDVLLSHAPGYSYLCGASENAELAPQDLAESEDAVCLWIRT